MTTPARALLLSGACALLLAACQAPNPDYTDEGETGSSDSSGMSSDPTTSATMGTTDPTLTSDPTITTNPTFTSTSTSTSTTDSTDPTSPMTTEGSDLGPRRMEFEITNMEGDSIPDFPVLLDLRNQDVQFEAFNPDEPAMFFSIDSNMGEQPLFHEVEVYRPDLGDVRIWIHVPLLGTDKTKAWMYYGGEPMGMQPPSQLTWPAFDHVHHFKGGETENASDGIASAFASMTEKDVGMVGDAIKLNPSGYVIFEGVDGGTGPNGEGEVSFSFRNDSNAMSVFAPMFFTAGEGGAHMFLAYYRENDSDNVYFGHDSDGDGQANIAGYGPLEGVNEQGWHHVVLRWLPFELYVDGAPVQLMGFENGGFEFSFAFQLGGDLGLDTFNGAIDEFRYSSNATAGTLTRAQFDSIFKPGDIVKVLYDDPWDGP